MCLRIDTHSPTCLIFTLILISLPPVFLISPGVGIQPEGLRSLFKEYVQGTEDEMRKPRSRGGTGLGLSICSKQVSVMCSWLK